MRPIAVGKLVKKQTKTKTKIILIYLETQAIMWSVKLILWKKQWIFGYHTIKNEFGRFLSKYKHGNDIHEHQKQ